MVEVFGLIFIGVISRLIPHPPNMTTVGAMSLFTGSKYPLKKAIVVVLSTMLITDLFLGLHGAMWATYGSFLAIVFIGKSISKKKNIAWIIGGSLVSSFLFFIVTNFAVWLPNSSIYPKTLAGLTECYIMALPFFRNTIIGNLMYSTIFFTGFEMIKSISKKPSLITNF
ncbi:DUF6580 family putative transport protein [Patescibacteria group bacterium]